MAKTLKQAAPAAHRAFGRLNWFDYAELYAYIAMQAPEGYAIVEVGVYMGRALSFLRGQLNALGKAKVILYGVDAFSRDVMPWGLEHTELDEKGSWMGQVQRSLDAARLSEGVVLSQGLSRHTPADLKQPVFAVFIDAAHDAENCYQDILYWEKQIAPGGIIAGHDFVADGDKRFDMHFQGVVDAVQRWAAERGYGIVYDGQEAPAEGVYVEIWYRSWICRLP